LGENRAGIGEGLIAKKTEKGRGKISLAEFFFGGKG